MNMRPHYSLAVAIVIFLIAVAALASPAESRDLSKLQEQALSHTAQLNGNCSATMIYSDRDKVTGNVETLFLTAKHCISNPADDQVLDLPVYQNGRVVKKERYIARHKGSWYKGDLALVVLKDRQTYFANTAKIAPVSGVPAMGADVVTIGYPAGLQLTVTPGVFGSYETINHPSAGTEYFRATPDVIGGNSGGALYRITDAGDYELIGVTSAGHRMHSFVAFYVPVDQIHEYLKVAVPVAVGAPAK